MDFEEWLKISLNNQIEQILLNILMAFLIQYFGETQGSDPLILKEKDLNLYNKKESWKGGYSDRYLLTSKKINGHTRSLWGGGRNNSIPFRLLQGFRGSFNR